MKGTLPPDEQLILDSALLESDQLLARSLHDDQQRRRKRLVWLSVILVGGVAMSTLLWLVMTGLTTATVSRADVNEAQQLSKEGWQLWQKQEFAEAEEKFAKSVELNPKDADAWNGLGWTQFNGGRSGEAVKAFKQCVKLKPKHPAGLNGLGQIYLMWGELGPAEKYLKKAAPNAPAAWYGLARLYLIQGDFKRAKPWVERLAEDPNNAEAKRMLAAVKNEKLPEDLKIMLQPAGKPANTEVDEEAEVETESTRVSTRERATNSLPQDEFSKWRKQLTSAGEDSRWYVGVNFGKTLSALPGDEAYKILQPCWPQIADSVRPQILKGFTPGMKKSSGINDRFFDIMLLGLNDPHDRVREFATIYLNGITLSSVADDPETFKLWLAEWDERPASEIALENCQKQIEEMRSLDASQVPEAMQRLFEAANDLREFKEMQKVAIKSGMYEIIDGWLEKGLISPESPELVHLELNVPRPTGEQNP